MQIKIQIGSFFYLDKLLLVYAVDKMIKYENVPKPISKATPHYLIQDSSYVVSIF